MAKQKFLEGIITIDNSSAVPIYKQIVNSIHKSIDNGLLKRDDMIPSVNHIAKEFSLARGSVFTAYNELRSSGIIDSIPGKGYYVVGVNTNTNKQIFLLFSTFTPYKETLFNALRESLPKNCVLDIYFHYHNIKIFETLIKEQAPYYNTFVIMPELNERTREILSNLEPKHTFLMDVGYKQFKDDFSGVFQNFEKDIFSILQSSQQLIDKYKRLFLVFPKGLSTKDIIKGFNKFSKKASIQTGVLNQVPAQIEIGDAFIVIDDNHLVEIVQAIKANKFKLGKDIGLISYNEVNLKSIIAGGITTITTDFVSMGKQMAEMILSNKGSVVENPFILIDRKSF